MKIRADGDCMYDAVLSCVCVLEGFGPLKFRKQIGVYATRNIKFFKDRIKPTGESLESYLRNLIEGKSYRDRHVLEIISIMWNIVITVINPFYDADKIWHREELGDSDVILLWNGCNHYSGSVFYEQPQKWLKPKHNKIFTNSKFHIVIPPKNPDLSIVKHESEGETSKLDTKQDETGTGQDETTTGQDETTTGQDETHTEQDKTDIQQDKTETNITHDMMDQTGHESDKDETRHESDKDQDKTGHESDKDQDKTRHESDKDKSRHESDSDKYETGHESDKDENGNPKGKTGLENVFWHIMKIYQMQKMKIMKMLFKFSLDLIVPEIILLCFVRKVFCQRMYLYVPEIILLCLVQKVFCRR